MVVRSAGDSVKRLGPLILIFHFSFICFPFYYIPCRGGARQNRWESTFFFLSPIILAQCGHTTCCVKNQRSVQHPRSGVLEKPFQAITPLCTARGFPSSAFYFSLFSSSCPRVTLCWFLFAFYLLFSYLLLTVRGCVQETFVLPPSSFAYAPRTNRAIYMLPF